MFFLFVSSIHLINHELTALYIISVCLLHSYAHVCTHMRVHGTAKNRLFSVQLVQKANLLDVVFLSPAFTKSRVSLSIFVLFLFFFFTLSLPFDFSHFGDSPFSSVHSLSRSVNYVRLCAIINRPAAIVAERSARLLRWVAEFSCITVIVHHLYAFT